MFFKIVEPVVTMAAALSVQSPFLSNLRCDYETMQSRKELISDHGDPISLLNAFNEWIQVLIIFFYLFLSFFFNLLKVFRLKLQVRIVNSGVGDVDLRSRGFMK